MKFVDSVEELERIKYFHDGHTQYLAIDIREILLERGKTLWIWVYKPQPIPGGGPAYKFFPRTLTYDCTPDNSRKVKLAGEVVNRRGDKQDLKRIWIPIQVPDENLAGVHYLLLPTSLLTASGWGCRLPLVE